MESSNLGPWIGAAVAGFGIITSVMIAAIGAFISLLSRISKIETEIARIETRSTERWREVQMYMLNDAKIDSVNARNANLNSPIKFTNDIKSSYAEIAEELKQHYTSLTENADKPDPELLFKFNKFSKWLTTNICVPRRITYGQGVLAAIEVAKELHAAAVEKVQPSQAQDQQETK